MRKLFVLILLALSFFAQAHSVLIGTGNGTVSKTSMENLQSGDTLAIKAGNYSGGGVFSNLHDITIINSGGVVTFTAPVDLGAGVDMKNITWTGTGYKDSTYGFVFNGFGKFGYGTLSYLTNSAIVCTAKHYEGLTIDHVDFEGIDLFPGKDAGGICIDMGHANIKYDGTTNTLKMYRSRFSFNKINRCFCFWQGSYFWPKTLDNICDSVSIDNNIITNSTGNGACVSGTITHFNIFNNKVTYDGPYKYMTGDTGAFFVAGNGEFHHNYHKGHRGYSLRLFGFSIKPIIAETWIYNNIDLSTWVYAGFDVNSDSTHYGKNNPFLGPTNVHLVFNTVGNKGDDHNHIGDYTSPIVTVTPFHDGATCEIRNNLAFAIVHPQNNPIFEDYSSPNGGSTPIVSNNLYFDSSEILGKVLADTNRFCEPVANSPVQGEGMAIAKIINDYKYQLRQNPPTIGAVEIFGTKKKAFWGSINWKKIFSHKKRVAASILGLLFIGILVFIRLKKRNEPL
jgi:hypothetical protein